MQNMVVRNPPHSVPFSVQANDGSAIALCRYMLLYFTYVNSEVPKLWYTFSWEKAANKTGVHYTMDLQIPTCNTSAQELIPCLYATNNMTITWAFSRTERLGTTVLVRFTKTSHHTTFEEI
ncbi:hypothetical protein AVEN_183022-1 [Araneus ventricosus]|uniref:Uncharacterized protein n=1 Tax=Araneus ventricosus TaxID=182803 RepID=A0A4Y2RL48_ARAVE|nr:hypothetical protein AVEN_183022-1 [Araneus ventricosus]